MRLALHEASGRHPRAHSGERGLTLLELLVAMSVLSFVVLILYGAFATVSQGRKKSNTLAERYRLGRVSMERMSRELSSAYLSAHAPLIPALNSRVTAFLGTDKRIDFNAFAHRRLVQDAHESDQCELSYFVAERKKPDETGRRITDLVRREQVIVDTKPGRGGVVQILVDDVESFNARYLDPQTGQWTETWDSTNQTAQFARLPLQVEFTLVMRGGPAGAPIRLKSRTSLMIPRPLAFGL